MQNRIQSGRLVRAALVALIAGSATLGLEIVSATSANADVGATLSQADATAIAGTIATAISNAKAGLPAGATQQQIDDAVAAAISSATQTLMGQYQNDDPAMVAAAIVTASLDAGGSSQAVGKGMALAAIALAGTKADAIATAVGRTGNADVLASFDATVKALGGELGKKLALEADGAASVGSAGVQAGVTVGGPPGNASVGVGLGCANPSCT
jgi:hypothetical protein